MICYLIYVPRLRGTKNDTPSFHTYLLIKSTHSNISLTFVKKKQEAGYTL